MGLSIIILFSLLAVILLITKSLVNNIYEFLLKIIRSKKTAVWVLAIIFLPGTIIHELAHFIIALVLRVPTGPISVFPSFEKDDLDKKDKIEIKMGHLMIAKTDPVRMTIIGIAPLICGLFIIYFLGKFFLYKFNFIWQAGIDLNFIIGILFLFIVSSTMFSSKQDLKSLLITFPFAVIIGAAIYLSGIRISFETNVMLKIEEVLSVLNKSLVVTAVCDYFFFFLLSILNRLGSRG